jgi:hypothetical protein
MRCRSLGKNGLYALRHAIVGNIVDRTIKPKWPI